MTLWTPVENPPPIYAIWAYQYNRDNFPIESTKLTFELILSGFFSPRSLIENENDSKKDLILFISSLLGS